MDCIENCKGDCGWNVEKFKTDAHEEWDERNGDRVRVIEKRVK